MADSSKPIQKQKLSKINIAPKSVSPQLKEKSGTQKDTVSVASPSQQSKVQSPASPLSDTVASPISWDNSVYQNRSSTPESEVESSLAYGGTETYNAKRKRKFKKKKDRSRSNMNLLTKLPHDSTEESEDILKAELKDNLDLLHVVESPGDEKTNDIKQIQLVTSIEMDVQQLTLLSNSDEIDVCNPSCKEHLLRTVDLSRQKYEVVSEGVQTDWSWLRDKQKLEVEKESKKDISQLDAKDILEKLKFGFYGGFGVPELEMSFEQRDEQDILHDDKSVKDNNTTKLIGDNHLQTGSNNLHRSVKSAQKIKQQKKSLRKVKSANTKNKKHNEESDKSDGNNISINLLTLKNHPKPLQGPPEILKYHREKSGQKKKSPPELDTIRTTSVKVDIVDPPTGCGVFSGTCQFCGKPILSLPDADKLQDLRTDDQIYCCPEYEYFIKLHVTSYEETDKVEDEIIDITPHAPFGSKTNRKAAKERVADRLRERELERQRAAAQQANLFSFSRQMKTIQYSLASTKCMLEGWTVIPATAPPEESLPEEDIFQIEVNSTLLQKSEVLNEKFYDNGKHFLTIFPDGTGCCYYPNGNVAVMIISTEKGKFTYIVQKNKRYDDDLEDSGLLALFEPNATGICYYQNEGKIRLFVNAHGGIELDKNGRKRKRWQWYFVKGHVHAPPFQPLCFPLNKFLSVRVLDQQNIALIFTSSKRSVRFNVGANLKALRIEGHGQFGADESETYLLHKKRHVNSVLTELHSILRLPKSTRFDRLFPGRKSRQKDEKQKPLPGQHLPPIDSEASLTVN